MAHKYKRILLALALGVFSLTLFACKPKYAITTTRSSLQLGDATVDVLIHEAEVPGLTYLNLHDDENTSVKAALDVIGEYGGRVIELKHSGDRRITFNLGDGAYEFDPNRMFTDVGRRSTLERFSSVTEDALVAIQAFADEVLLLLNPAELEAVVTLHNTSPGTYSISLYTGEGELAGDAESVYVSDKMDPKDYFFVTDRDLYNQLSQMELNVVLQDNVNATDDGSLSVWCAQQHIVYANSEALNGHRRVQADMLLRLHEILYNDR